MKTKTNGRVPCAPSGSAGEVMVRTCVRTIDATSLDRFRMALEHLQRLQA